MRLRPLSALAGSILQPSHATVLTTLVSRFATPTITVVAALLFPGFGGALALPIPTASLNVPAEGFVGEPQSFTVSFDNTSPTDPGYGPYVDLVLPATGADGAGVGVDDGIAFVAATYLGVPVNSTVLTCPIASHPYTGLPVACTAGDQLVVLELPFGSFTNDQPPAVIDVSVNLSNLADVGTPLPITATGWFRYGADPLDNPGTDPPISGATATSNFTPTLLELTKTYIGPEDETATGPNYPRQYTLTVDIADGQTITDLDITDFLPDNLAFLSIISTSPGGAVVLQTPTVGAPAVPPDNDLVVRFASVTGSLGASDAVVTFEYYVPEFDAAAARIIDDDTGDDVLSLNNASAEGDWTPIDNRDAPAHPVVDEAGPEHILTDKSVAIQKGVSIIGDVGPTGPSPGDLLEYTLEFQISDFFAFQNLRIENDVLSDGQRVDGSFTPTLSVTEDGATSSGVFDVANYSVVVDSPGTGSSTLFFDISGELITRSLSGQLIGGLVPDGGPANDGATTGTIVYRAIIQDAYSDTFPSGSPSLDNGDELSNAVVIDGDVLDNVTLTPTGFSEADDSSAGLTIVGGQVFKSIYARNGVIGPVTQLAPGDTITYRIQFDLPTGDVESLLFQDYLPLPVLYATEVTAFIDTISAAAPPAGSAKFGATDTFRTLSGIVPAVSSDAVANLLQFDYGTYENPANTSATVDILFTVTVANDPFADGLYLTNQVRQSDHDTFNEAQQNDAIVQFQLTQPVLAVRKGVVAATNPARTFSPATVGPVAFSAPGGGCPRFASTISSGGLASTPINSNVSNIDAGDVVSFAIVVNNTGSGLTGAFDVQVRDTLPAGFSVPSGGLNLCVTDGSGAIMPFSSLGAGLFDAGGGLELTDPGPTATPEGALDPYSASGGRNVLIITYDLQADGPGDTAPVTPRQTLTNTATLFNYAGQEGGPDHTATDLTDPASATIASPAIVKTIASIVPNGTGASSTTPGDTVTYSLAVTLPEGETPGLTLTDTLPRGFQYVPGSTTVIPGTFNGSVTGSPGVVTSGTPATGQVVTISFGTVSVNGDNVASTNSFVVTLQALVLNSAQNVGLPSAQNKTNQVTLNSTGNPAGGISSQVTTTFREPQLVISKSMVPSSPDAGDVVTVTLTVNNTGTAQAHDVVVDDILPGNFFDLTPVTSVNEGTTPVDFSYNYTTPTVTYSGGPIASGASRVFTFTARVRADVVTGSNYTNTGSVDGDSQSGVVTEERSTSDSDDAVAGVPPSSVSKALTSTSENSTDPGDANAASNPPTAIGEVATFTLTYTLLEGVTSNVSLVDVLPNGMTYIAGSATLDRSSTALVAASDPGGINSGTPGTPVAVTPSLSGTEVSVSLGDVTNSDTVNATAETYTLRLQAVVDNSATNNAGTPLIDVGRIRYDNVLGAMQQVDSAPVTVHVAEPVVSVVKTANPTSADGGSLITFTLVVSNTAAGANAASAFEWVINDPLPVEYQAQAVTFIDTGATGAAVSASFTGNTLTGTIDQLDPGEAITITYTATIDPATPYGTIITNVAAVTTTSLPGSNGTGNATPGAAGSPTGERTGGGGVNDLNGSDPAVVTIDDPTITKTTLSPQSYYPIGDTPTFEITVGVPVGTSNDFVITDVLPSGLAYNTGTLSVTLPPGATSSNAPLTDGNPSFFTLSGNTITFDFGMVVVPNGGDAVITYMTTVRNVFGNQDGVLLVNTAQLSFDVGGSPQVIGPVVNDIPVRVGEPNLAMSKVITAGAAGADAGDTVSWQVTIQNTGHTTAYATDWSDVLPNGLFQISGVVVTPSGASVFLNGTTTTVSSGDAVVSTTTNANDTVSLPLLEMAAGATLQIDFDSIVMNTVTPGQVLNNATRASYSSLLAGGRTNATNPGNVDDDDDSDLDNYEETASRALTIGEEVAIDKTVSPTTFTIGQNATFVVRVDLQEGTLPSLIVTDILPAGLTYVSHSIAFGHAGMVAGNPGYNTRLGSGQTVQFDFGDVLNPANASLADDFINISITAHVDNVVGNQDGAVLRNGEQAEGSSVFLQYGSTPTQVTFDADAAQAGVQGLPINIVEPLLDIDKSVTPTEARPGDTVTFTVNIEHNAASTSDAYDLVVVDTLPSGLTYVPGSASLPPGDVTVAGQQLTFRIMALTLAAGSTGFTYQAQVDTNAAIGVPLTNDAQLSWASIPGATGATASGRTGAGGLNDYATAGQASVTPTTPDLAITKTHGILRVNENGTYTLSITNVSSVATMGAITVTDNLPNGLTYVSGTGTGWSCSAAGQLVTCTNPGPLGAGANTRIALTVAVGSAAYPTVTNTAMVSTPFDSSTPNNTAHDPSVIRLPSGGSATPTASVPGAPDLGLAKNHSAVFNVGFQGVYSLTVTNVGVGPTTGTITVTDPLPNGLTYSSASGSGWTCGASGQLVTCTHPGPFGPGAGSTVTLVVNIGSGAFPTITNSATVSTAGDTKSKNDTAYDPTTVKNGSGSVPTPTFTPAGPVATSTPTSAGVGGTPTPTPTVPATPTSVPATSTPTFVFPENGCTGSRRFKLFWREADPERAELIISATKCPPPEDCFGAISGSTVTVPPVILTVTDSVGTSISTTLDSIPSNQGQCPGGVDAYCHNGSTRFHIDRLRFVYGRGGLTTVRGKLNFELDPPLLPNLLPPVVVNLRDSGTYSIDLPYTYCDLRARRNTNLLRCR